MSLHIVEKAQREGIEVDNLGMNAEIAFDSSSNTRAKLE